MASLQNLGQTQPGIGVIERGRRHLGQHQTPAGEPERLVAIVQEQVHRDREVVHGGDAVRSVRVPEVVPGQAARVQGLLLAIQEVERLRLHERRIPGQLVDLLELSQIVRLHSGCELPLVIVAALVGIGQQAQHRCGLPTGSGVAVGARRPSVEIGRRVQIRVPERCPTL